MNIYAGETFKILKKITLGRSIGGLNCDIGGFLDTNVRSILNKFLQCKIQLFKNQLEVKIVFEEKPKCVLGCWLM